MLFGLLKRDAFKSEEQIVGEEAKVTVNYRVVGPTFFGDIPRGEVLPRWVAERSGSTAEQLVDNGTLEETDAPVTRRFDPPAPKTDTDPMPELVTEGNRLRHENTLLAESNKALAAENAALKAEKDSQVRALGEQTAQVTHWRTVAEQHKARADATEADLKLERETKPGAADKPAPAKAKDKVAA